MRLCWHKWTPWSEPEDRPWTMVVMGLAYADCPTCGGDVDQWAWA